VYCIFEYASSSPVQLYDTDYFMVNFLRLMLLCEYRDATGWSTLVIHWQEV